MSLFGLKIVSGGQTGADRAALDFALAYGVPHGGWCPKGRRAEDGPLAACYQLTETPSADAEQRTEWNVRDADGTVIFSMSSALAGGSLITMEFARRYARPLLHLIQPNGPQMSVHAPEQTLIDFIRQNRIRVLNIAGPRASEEPEVGAFVTDILRRTWNLARDERLAQAIPIDTQRLRLRWLFLEDAAALAKLAGRREIADTTISIPHPYSEEQARQWIAARSTESRSKELALAITRKEDGALVGAISLRDIDIEHSQAEIGFWIGVEWWGQGYATEAVRAVLSLVFNILELNRVCAHHMVRNSASGRVLQKVGMQCEGLLRERVRKWGRFEDVVLCSILRADWQRLATVSSQPGPAADVPSPTEHPGGISGRAASRSSFALWS